MADTTPKRRTRSGRNQDGSVPERVELQDGEQSVRSGVSALTESTSSNRRRVEERNALTLFQLSNVASPLAPSSDPALSPLEEEFAYDCRCYKENAGASDSEDEDEDDGFPSGDDDIHDRATLSDQNLAAEDNRVAETLLEDFVAAADDDDSHAEEESMPWCHGAPIGWKPPKAPSNWTIPAAKVDKGEPASFDLVDNPGGWSDYTYVAKFKQNKSGGSYIHHALPTGVTPVPANADGKRIINGWEFHYGGDWKNIVDDSADPNSRLYRDGATRDNMFPRCRSGSLDQNVLRRLGLTKDRMVESSDGAPDALFFYQLILPIHLIDKEKNTTIPDDPRQTFYANVSKWTNLYAVGELDLGSGYGHSYTNTNAAELLRWDGVLVMDGVRGGSDGAILRRFDRRQDNTAYDKHIDNSFTKTRWLELKRVVKLCNNLTAKKKGEDGYDPAYKYNYIFDTIVKNVNALSLYACLDLCGDETTFGHQGHGESESGLLKQIKGKPGITKGMQTVIVSDVDWIRPRAFLHRHKKQKIHCKQQGPNEVRLIWEEQLLPLTRPDNDCLGRALFSQKPHMTWDNYFSGDDTMEYAAEQGFGLTMTCRRDRLPKGVPGKYWHKEKTQPQAHRPKCARFERPIFATKRVGQSLMQITSFQSTSSCNLASVNALNSCQLYAQTKERGRKNQRRKWAIEMNEARHLYLKTYGAIDRMDHLIKNCCMNYR